MKRTTLAAKDGDLLEKLIAKYGKVVTARQIEAEARHTWDYQQTHNRIQQLVKNGWLIRIKRGLYAIADLSSRGFLSVSPYVIANLLVEKSYVSFEAALAYRGMFDQFTGQFISVSLKQFKVTAAILNMAKNM
jgi:predicted transcriptional regulator of viral defense system